MNKNESFVAKALFMILLKMIFGCEKVYRRLASSTLRVRRQAITSILTEDHKVIGSIPFGGNSTPCSSMGERVYRNGYCYHPFFKQELFKIHMFIYIIITFNNTKSLDER
jgi:hypothetical protein